jgi:hypothetical protein
MRDYLKGKAAYIVSSAVIAAITVMMIAALNPEGGGEFSILVGALYILGAFIPLAIEYRRKKAFYDSLMDIFDKLERKNLISAMNPRRISSRAYFCTTYSGLRIRLALKR